MKKRRGRKISLGNVNIIFSNRVLYSLIALLVLAIVGVGVYATVDTTKGWHDVGQIQAPANCVSNGGFLKFDGTNWVCAGVTVVAETDPTVNNYVKNKASCTDITGGTGLCDGVDNDGTINYGVATRSGPPGPEKINCIGNFCIKSQYRRVYGTVLDATFYYTTVPTPPYNPTYLPCGDPTPLVTYVTTNDGWNCYKLTGDTNFNYCGQGAHDGTYADYDCYNEYVR